MALDVQMTGVGALQGRITGTPPSKGKSDKWSAVLAFEMGCESLVDSTSSGTLRGPRTHSPLVITNNGTDHKFAELSAFQMNSMVPLDPPSSVSGKRQHFPFRVNKEVDNASPSFYQGLVTNESSRPHIVKITRPVDSTSPRFLQALMTNEVMTEVNIVVGHRRRGKKESHSIKLSNAAISSVKRVSVPGGNGPCEEVQFSSEKIEKMFGLSA
jgi:type VI protein secretion system component Hcp